MATVKKAAKKAPAKKAGKPTAKAPLIKVPENIGAAVDLLDTLRDERLRIGAELAHVKEKEDFVEAAIFNKFGKQDLEGARGKQAQASISRRESPRIEDDQRFFAYVKRTGQIDLLQRRLSSEAVKERWKAGKEVPGVGKFTKIELSLTKLRSKK